MILRYFNTSDDECSLKRKRKLLAKKYHPDVFGEQGTKIMQDVNSEYDYCVNRKLNLIPDESLFSFMRDVFVDLKNRKPGIKTFNDTIFQTIVSIVNVSENKMQNKRR